jgi:hypothetical protein
VVVLEVGSRSPSTGAPRTSRDSRRGSLRHEWALGAGLRCPREHPIWMSPYSERRLIQHAKQNIAQLSDGCPLQQSPSLFISLSKLTRRPESRIHSREFRHPARNSDTQQGNSDTQRGNSDTEGIQQREFRHPENSDTKGIQGIQTPRGNSDTQGIQTPINLSVGAIGQGIQEFRHPGEFRQGVARHPPFGLPDTHRSGCQTPTVWVARHPPFGEGCQTPTVW